MPEGRSCIGSFQRNGDNDESCLRPWKEIHRNRPVKRIYQFSPEEDMSRVRELFAFSVERDDIKWKSLIKSQHCRFSGKRCFKVRKSQADVSIGTCTVQYGADNKDVIICPNRLLERKQMQHGQRRHLQTAGIKCRRQHWI